MDGITKPPVNRDDRELIEDRAERAIEEISKREREAAVILDVKNNKKRVFRKRILVVFTVLLFCFISFCGILFLSYNSAINYKTNDSKKVNFNISKGESLDLVAQKLADKKIIISKNSFIFYARINNKRNILAGSYQLSSSMTIPEVLDILNKGQVVDNFNITFLPGGTVKMAKNALLKAGQITAEEAERHPQRNIITQSIGQKDEIQPDFGIITLEEGDYIVINSDGLSNMVAGSEIYDILKSDLTLPEKAQTLIRFANNAGGLDNITVALVYFDKEEEA